MLAKVALRTFTPTYELLEAPHSLHHQSKCGRQPDAPDTCGPHQSGCGIAWREGGTLRVEKRGPDDRWDESFDRVVRGLETDALLAHNRLASPGLKIDVSLSHPIESTFAGVPVAFCHNGGVRDLMDAAKERGVTDSRIFFETLLGSVPDLQHDTMVTILRKFADEWSYTSLTAMLLTPTLLVYWRCYDGKDPRRDDYEKYYTLYRRANASELCVVSEPVDSTTAWENTANRTLVTVERSAKALQIRSSSF